MTSDSPCFTNGGTGGGGVPGSKARVMQRLQQLGWQDIMQVRRALHCWPSLRISV
jgi:hypothetical protein